MGDANDLKATVEALTTALKTLPSTVEANAKAIATLTSDRTSSSGTKTGSGEHHNDRPLRFQKMDFPRCDGVEVVLQHFHRCRYRSNPLWFFCWRGSDRTRCWLSGNMVDTRIYVVRGVGAQYPTSMGEWSCIALS
jgi:hypothetical protein